MPQKIFFKKLKKNVTQNQVQDYTDNNSKLDSSDTTNYSMNFNHNFL